MKQHKILITIVFVMTMVLSLSACGNKLSDKERETFNLLLSKSESVSILDQPVSLAIVAANRANSDSPIEYIDASEICTPILWAAEPGGEVAFIDVSGTPTIVEKQKTPTSNAVSEEQKKEDRAFYAQKITQKLASVNATAPEADLLAALIQAGNWLQSQPDENKKMCVVVDSGISTTGLLSFTQEGFLCSDIQTIVSQLEQHYSIPDFQGVEIACAALGKASSPQDDPGPTQRQWVIDLYQAIVETGGGTFDRTKITHNEPSKATQFPVTPIDFPDEKSLVFATPWELGETQVKFIEDKAVFVDEKAVRSALTPVANALKQNPSETVLIAGTTATEPPSEECLKLSNLRAAAVKAVLVNEFVIPETQIQTIGLGYDRDPFPRAQERDVNGNWIEAEAAKNRRVIIMDVDDPLAKKILDAS